MTENSPIRVIRGKFSEYKDQVIALMGKHWEETGIPTAGKELRLDIDFDVYFDLEERNQHLGLGLEQDGELIGYASFMIYSHHQHKSKMFAQTDGFFVNPKKRGFSTFRAICKLFKKAETILSKEYSVEYLYLGTHAQNDLKFLAECLSYVPASVTYVKRLV